MAKLREITYEEDGKKLPWLDTLAITSAQPVQVASVEDDFARELALCVHLVPAPLYPRAADWDGEGVVGRGSYEQALEAVERGRERVLAAGAKFDRPDDYFAEMVKTDDHMARIRQRLASESVRIARSEEAAKQRALKRYGKQAQADKLQERARAKAADLDKIRMIRKGASHSCPRQKEHGSVAPMLCVGLGLCVSVCVYVCVCGSVGAVYSLSSWCGDAWVEG
jgi:rRNA-processing protein EBP2